MAKIMTENPLEISGGHCHTGTAPFPAQTRGVRINGFAVLRNEDAYAPASCGDDNHSRECLSISHRSVRVNNYAVFTTDDFLGCAEPAGIARHFVFVN